MRSSALICVLLITGMSPSVVLGGPHTNNKNKACPDKWALTDKAIPVVWPKTNPWGVASGSVDDKAQAKTHLSWVKPVHTVDREPVTTDDLVNDPLTVASECLVYRNFEVDYWNYPAPPAVTLKPSNSWIPVVIF